MNDVLNRVLYWHSALGVIKTRLKTFNKLGANRHKFADLDLIELDYMDFCYIENSIIESCIILYGSIFNQGKELKGIIADNKDSRIKAYQHKLKKQFELNKGKYHSLHIRILNIRDQYLAHIDASKIKHEKRSEVVETYSWGPGLLYPAHFTKQDVQDFNNLVNEMHEYMPTILNEINT